MKVVFQRNLPKIISANGPCQPDIKRYVKVVIMNSIAIQSHQKMQSDINFEITYRTYFLAEIDHFKPQNMCFLGGL